MITANKPALLLIGLGLGFGLVGCGGATAHGPGRLRFHNQEPITLVNDRVPLAKPPESFDLGLVEYYFKGDLIEPTRRALTVGEERPAKNANSLGDVPDSAWFTNRTLTPEQVRRGPGLGGPDRSQPWRVVGVKQGGMAVGMKIVDARGDSYVLKFDERKYPETETAADAIVQRLTWAFGYNVPDNQVVTFRREQIVLDPKAELKNRDGSKRPMTEADFANYIGAVDPVDGIYRALTSRYIDGKPVGGVEPEGVRKDDANDRIPHELRRDLRGQRVLWAWVNHPDLKSANAHASMVEGNYVKWYMLDFGDSLGVINKTIATPRLGYRTIYAVTPWLKSLVTFGLYVHPWEREVRPPPDYRGLGDFESEQFDPATWVPNHNWRPTDLADRHDQLWATEILLRLTPAHIRAAVDAGQYTDSRSSEYVIKTLIERQRKIGRWALARIAPITHFEIRERGGDLSLCFDDLWLRHRYGAEASTRYVAASYDYDGRAVASAPRVGALLGGRTCLPPLRPGTARDGYTIVRIDIARGDSKVPPAFVHIARGAQGFRVIGIDRR